jgi:hypothetical protein
VKKLFISCPMNGATKEEIDKRMEILHKLAELHFGEDLEVIDTWIEEDAPQNCKNTRVWNAGESIKRLSEADYYVGIDVHSYEHEKYLGCYIEDIVARMMDVHIRVFPKEIFIKD